MRSRLTRLALWSWPPHLRARHGRSLEATTRAAWEACAGAPIVVRQWRRARLLLDLVQSGLAERAHLSRGVAPEAELEHSERRWSSFTPISRNDIVQAWRSFARRPGFATVVFLTLTL